MPEALRKRLRLNPHDVVPPTEFELNSAPDAMSAFEQICLAIPASGAIIAVRDTSGLRSVGSLGDAPEVGSRLPSDFGIAIECLETGSPVYRDLTDDAQRVRSVGLTMEGVSQVRSAVAIPMHASGAIIGLIAVFSRRESSIQPRDIESLTRIADFWGPLMADEWFPDGIPAAIIAEVPAEQFVAATVTEFPRPAEEPSEPSAVEAPVLEAPVIDALPATESEPAFGLAEAPQEITTEQSADVSETTNEVEPIVAPTVEHAAATTAIDSEAPLAAQATPDEAAPLKEPPPSPEPAKTQIDEPPKISDADLSVEALTIAQAAKERASPVFLAPVEQIPPEAFHSGEPNRYVWLVVLVVFLIVLLPVWALRSRWRHSNAALRNSASAAASNANAANSSASGANGAASSPSTAASTKAAAATNTNNSSPTAKTIAPDEDLPKPKPLPDLNTPPPTNPPAASSTPKPSLPAIVKRILKSPTAAAAKPAAPPSAPEITASLQPPLSTEPAPPEESPVSKPAESSNAESAPEPAQPVNPAGIQPPNLALVQTLKAHSGWVSSLAFSPTGKLASGSWDRTVKFWDLSTGHEIRAVTDKLKQVQALAFSRDGNLLAVEDASDTITIFDASTGQPIRELPTDKTVPSVGISWVYSIAFSPDGRWLASAPDDRTVRIWDVATGTKIRDLNGPRRPVLFAAFSPNGELVATGNDEKSIQLWNVASGAPTSTLTGHKKVINAVAFSPDGKLLASASGDKTIRLWDVANGKHIRTLSGHQAAVSSISFSPDGRWLASGSWDKTVRIWNVASGKEVQTLRPDARAIYSVTFDPHSRWLAAGSEDGAIEIWQWNGATATNQSPATQ